MFHPRSTQILATKETLLAMHEGAHPVYHIKVLHRCTLEIVQELQKTNAKTLGL